MSLFPHKACGSGWHGFVSRRATGDTEGDTTPPPTLDTAQHLPTVQGGATLGPDMNTSQHAYRVIANASTDYLTDLEAVTPRDGDEMRLVERERGAAETIRHLARSGMLTEEGLAEARKILSAGREWLHDLETDQELPVRPKL